MCFDFDQDKEFLSCSVIVQPYEMAFQFLVYFLKKFNLKYTATCLAQLYPPLTFIQKKQTNKQYPYNQKLSLFISASISESTARQCDDTVLKIA